MTAIEGRHELPAPTLELAVQLAITVAPVISVGATWRGRRRIDVYHVR